MVVNYDWSWLYNDYSFCWLFFVFPGYGTHGPFLSRMYLLTFVISHGCVKLSEGTGSQWGVFRLCLVDLVLIWSTGRFRSEKPYHSPSSRHGGHYLLHVLTIITFSLGCFHAHHWSRYWSWSSPSSSSNQSGWWIDCVYTYITFAPDSIHPISISIMNSYRSMLFFAAETEDFFRCHYHLFEQGRVTGLQSTPVRVGWLVPGWNIIY